MIAICLARLGFQICTYSGLILGKHAILIVTMHAELFTKCQKSLVEINSFNNLRLIYSQYVPNASSDNFKILLIYLKVRNMSWAS